MYRIIKKTKNIIRNPKGYFAKPNILWYRQNLSHKISPYSRLDDRFFLEYLYYKKFNKKLDLKNPKTFTEKLQWLKLYNRKPIHKKLVDKFAVRDFVKERIGPSYLNELLGVNDNVDEINWRVLPDKFVLKTTHGSGQNIIVRDKSILNINEINHQLNDWQKENYYDRSREWPYKHVPHRIICEKYMEGDPYLGLLDYKFFCFNGKPQFVSVDFDRFTLHKQYHYDMNWQRLPFYWYPPPEQDAPRPDSLDEMIDVAKRLSKGLIFSRVDLFSVNNKVVFGEITFYPGGGFRQFMPIEYETIIGEMIELPSKGKR